MSTDGLFGFRGILVDGIKQICLVNMLKLHDNYVYLDFLKLFELVQSGTALNKRIFLLAAQAKKSPPNAPYEQCAALPECSKPLTLLEDQGLFLSVGLGHYEVYRISAFLFPTL